MYVLRGEALFGEWDAGYWQGKVHTVQLRWAWYGIAWHGMMMREEGKEEAKERPSRCSCFFLPSKVPSCQIASNVPSSRFRVEEKRQRDGH
jgi:hypothetical protein